MVQSAVLEGWTTDYMCDDDGKTFEGMASQSKKRRLPRIRLGLYDATGELQAFVVAPHESGGNYIPMFTSVDEAVKSVDAQKPLDGELTIGVVHNINNSDLLGQFENHVAELDARRIIVDEHGDIFEIDVADAIDELRWREYDDVTVRID